MRKLFLVALCLLLLCLQCFSCSGVKKSLTFAEADFLLNGTWTRGDDKLTFDDKKRITFTGSTIYLEFDCENQEGRLDFELEKRFRSFVKLFSESQNDDEICFEGRYELTYEARGNEILFIKCVLNKINGTAIPDEYGVVSWTSVLFYESIFNFCFVIEHDDDGFFKKSEKY